MTVSVTVAAATPEAKTGTRQDEGSPASRLGLAVRPLNDAERLASGLADGLMVEGVYGPATSSGIQPGDVILSLNGTPVTSQEQLGTLAAKAGKQVALLILHDNNRVFVSVELR
jgi:serine protease Do